MRTCAALTFTILLFVGLSACGESTPTDTPDEPVAQADTDALCPSLLGSWELVSIADDAPALSGTFESDPDYVQAPTLKVLNETHWMFIRQSSGQFIHAQGGRYTLESGGFYTEIVEYSAIPSNIGKSFSFECKVEGDSLWHHVGGLGDARYREVWRRVR